MIKIWFGLFSLIWYMTSPYSTLIWGVIPACEGTGRRKEKRVISRNKAFLVKDTSEL
jgi:hypothetical protein